MPFVELTTSQQEAAYDADGYQHITRTFKVWGVNPVTFFSTIRDIPHRDANATPPNNSRLPDYGDVLTTPDGPRSLLNGAGVFTSTELIEYILRPESAVSFLAIARYTNDPRRATQGQNYNCQQLTSLVPIPYVRVVPVLVSNGGGSFSATESSINQPMALRRTSQTVTVPRSSLASVHQAAAKQVNCLHDLDRNRWPHKFEGYDVRMRGAQRFEVTYHWTWESGIKVLALDGRQKIRDTNNSDVSTPGTGNPGPSAGVSAIYPPLTASLSDYIVSSGSPQRPTDSILAPFHTIEMLWTNVPFGGGLLTKTPVWLYRMPFVDTQPTGHRDLPGSERFEF